MNKNLDISLSTGGGNCINEFTFLEKSNEDLVTVTAKLSAQVREQWLKVLVSAYLDEIIKGEWTDYPDDGSLQIIFHLQKEDANKFSNTLKELQLKLSGFLNAN